MKTVTLYIREDKVTLEATITFKDGDEMPYPVAKLIAGQKDEQTVLCEISEGHEEELKDFVVDRLMMYIAEQRRNADTIEAIHARCNPHDNHAGMHHDPKCDFYTPF